MTLQVFVNDILSVRKSWVDSIAKFFETHDMRDNTLTLWFVHSYPYAVIWFVRDAYPNAAIWLV